MALSDFAIPVLKIILLTSTLSVSNLKQPRLEDRNIHSEVKMQLYHANHCLCHLGQVTYAF